MAFRSILKMFQTVDRFLCKGLCGRYFRLSEPSGRCHNYLGTGSTKVAADNM